jgi:hypothetical protein
MFRVIVGRFEIRANGRAGAKSVPKSEAVEFEVYRRERTLVVSSAHHCAEFEDAFDYCIHHHAIAQRGLAVAH